MEGLKQATIAFAPVIVFWLFCAAASARIAHLKNIPISVGLLLGALLGSARPRHHGLLAFKPQNRTWRTAAGVVPKPRRYRRIEILERPGLGVILPGGMRGRLHLLIAEQVVGYSSPPRG
jgi:hypothetical protein